MFIGRAARRLWVRLEADTKYRCCKVARSDALLPHLHCRLFGVRVPSEHGAAAAYAALHSGRYVPEPGERVAVVVCGANTDAATLARP